MKLHEERYQKGRALARALKAQYWPRLQHDRNIVGVAFGRRAAHGQVADDPALVVYVMRKIPKTFVPPSRLLPSRAYVGGDCIEVDVVETGPFYPLTFVARERTATAGISIGNSNEASAGTFGAVVVDNIDGASCILSNNHVLARENAAALGEVIVQPGVFDGGSSPGDDIATLRRFVMINATGNTVDCAIAAITGGLGGKTVIDQVHNNLIPTASADHPAVGLLFAGSCGRTIMNPIANVLSALNISFPNGAGATASADIDMAVEKVGRTTEYTTSSVAEIDATVTIGYDFGNATFDHQVTTAWMSDPGDSGSVIYRGGAGGSVDHCGCGTTSAASTALGVDLRTEQAMAEVVRDRFLRQTRLGSWAIDVFFLNEERLLERFHKADIGEDDRKFARKLFDRYADDARQAFVQGERSEQRITDRHLRDARDALKRAQRHMSRDEVEASQRLFDMAAEHGRGKNARELLALLNDEKLLSEVKATLAKVRSIKTSKEPC